MRSGSFSCRPSTSLVSKAGVSRFASGKRLRRSTACCCASARPRTAISRKQRSIWHSTPRVRSSISTTSTAPARTMLLRPAQRRGHAAMPRAPSMPPRRHLRSASSTPPLRWSTARFERPTSCSRISCRSSTRVPCGTARPSLRFSWATEVCSATAPAARALCGVRVLRGRCGRPRGHDRQSRRGARVARR